MVKINFKTTPTAGHVPETKSEQAPKTIPIPDEPTEKRRDVDVSFDSTESFFDKSDITSEETPLPESFVSEESSPGAAPQPGVIITSEEEEEIGAFRKSSSQKKLYMIFGIAAILLIIVIFIILQFMQKESVPVTETPEVGAKPSAEKPVSESPSLDEMAPVFSQNVATNAQLRGNLEKIISTKSRAAKYSLIVILPSEVTATVLADSREDIARFHLELKRAMPNLAFRIASVQAKISDGKEMLYADLTAPLKPAKSTGTATPPAVAQPQNIVNELKALAARHHVKLQYLKEGKIFNHGTYREILYYVNATGKKSQILSFFSDLTTTYPMVRVNKFSIYPYNLETITDQNLSTRINLSYFNPR